MDDLLEYLNKEIEELSDCTQTAKGGYVVIYHNRFANNLIYSVANGVINRISKDAQDISPFTPMNRVRVFKTFSDAREFASERRSIVDGNGSYFDYAIWTSSEYRCKLLDKCREDKKTIERILQNRKMKNNK